MALSMDEQRMLAEIERRLAADDPLLAARLTSFRLPRLSFSAKSQRSRLLASLLVLALVGVVSVLAYALLPFHAPQPGGAPAGHGGSAGPHPALAHSSRRQPTLSAGGSGGQAGGSAGASGTSRSGASAAKHTGTDGS